MAGSYSPVSAGERCETEAREEDAMQGDFLKAILEQEFGVTLDDDEFDLSNPEATVERLAEKVQEQRRQAEERRPSAKRPPNNWQKKRASRKKQPVSANPSKRFTANWWQPCTPTANQTPLNATAKLN